MANFPVTLRAWQVANTATMITNTSWDISVMVNIDGSITIWDSNWPQATFKRWNHNWLNKLILNMNHPVYENDASAAVWWLVDNDHYMTPDNADGFILKVKS